jgi:uncharacterized membrane protein (UPF0182 family)
VVAFQDRVVMSETLGSGLARLFSSPVGTTQTASTDTSAAADTATASPTGTVPSTGQTAPNASLLREAQDHYQRAISAQRSGDWTVYGQEIQRLGDVLKRLNASSR